MEKKKPSPDLLLLGAGGNAAVVLEALAAAGLSVSACVTPDGSEPSSPAGLPQIPEAALLERSASSTLLVNGIGAVDVPDHRAAVFLKFKEANFTFASVRHPSAILSPSAEAGEGLVLMAGAIVQTGARIGANVLINTRAVVEHHCRIGDHCHIASGAVLAGNVDIGERCLIGAGSVILQGVSIGAGALVAAGAVVTRDIVAGGRVAGIPARSMKIPESGGQAS